MITEKYIIKHDLQYTPPEVRSYAFCMVFHARWIFLTTSLPNPTQVTCDEGGIRRRVVRNPSRMENYTKFIFSHAYFTLQRHVSMVSDVNHTLRKVEDHENHVILI